MKPSEKIEKTKDKNVKIYSVGVWNIRLMKWLIYSQIVKIYSVGVWNVDAGLCEMKERYELKFTPLEFETTAKALFLHPLAC